MLRTTSVAAEQQHQRERHLPRDERAAQRSTARDECSRPPVCERTGRDRVAWR